MGGGPIEGYCAACHTEQKTAYANRELGQVTNGHGPRLVIEVVGEQVKHGCLPSCQARLCKRAHIAGIQHGWSGRRALGTAATALLGGTA